MALAQKKSSSARMEIRARNMNFLLVLTQGVTTWSTQRVDVGSFGITSIAVGQLTNRPGAGIYVGLRGTTNGSGRVMEFTSYSGVWQSNMVALSTNQSAFVLGVRGRDLLVSYGTTNASDGSLSAVSFTTNWNYSSMDTNTSHRGLGTLLQPQSQSVSSGALRLLDSGGVALDQVIAVTSTQGLAGYWSFDDGTAKDNSGNGNDGTIQGALPTAGINGEALSFDGVGGRVQMVPSASLNLRDALTIAAWIHPSSNALDPRGTIVRNGISSDELYSLFYAPPGKIGFEWSGGGVEWNTFYSPTNLISVDHWNHVAAARSDSHFIRLYVNGREVANIQGTRSTSLAPGWFTIGSTQPGSSVQDFRGIIDDVRIFNRALNSNELAASPTLSLLLSEPAAIRANNWRGHSLTSGSIRQSSSFSLLYTFADDKNTNGLIDFGDDFITAEYQLSGTNANLLTLSRQPIATFAPAQSYGLASVNFLNQSNEVFFTGKPDGQIFAWTATGTNALQRQLFSGHHAGKAWHALAGVKMLEPGEGLVGLRVAPTNQDKCDVIFWPSQAELPNSLTIPQTAPLTHILPAPNSGKGLAKVKIRIWDAEGNFALPMLQFQPPGTSNWVDASVLKLDGTNYSFSMRVPALPNGSEHEFLWNATTNLGIGTTNTVLLRARSLDVTLLGEWSEPMPYQIEIANDSDGDGMPDSWELAHNLNALSAIGDDGSSGDPDLDGFSNWAEYIADTDPQDDSKYLRISGIQRQGNSVQIEWQGGVLARQFLQRNTSLDGTNNWINLQTIEPPTQTNGFHFDEITTERSLFYRIQVERP